MSRISGRKATDVPDALKSIDVKAVLRKRGMYLKKRQNAELKEAAKPVAEVLVKKVKGKKAKAQKNIIEVVPQKYMSFSDEDVKTYVEKQVHSAEVLADHLDKAINKFLINTVLAKALENLPNLVTTKGKGKAKKTVHTKAALFDEADKKALVNQARIQLGPYLQNMATIAGNDAVKLLPGDDPYVPSEALRKRVEDNVGKFSGSMIETDQEHLSKIIIDGIEEGKGVPEISSTMKGDFTEYSKMQSDRITRTEVLRSSNQAAVDAYRQSGVVEGKQWVDYGADDECAELDGEVITLSGDFYAPGNDFQDGDPPLHPNCKCIVIPVLSKDDE